MLLSLDIDIMPNVRMIGEIAYKSPWIHFPRVIDEYVLYVVKSGELYIREGSTDYSLKKGDLLVLEPNIPHVGFRESCCDYFYAHFKHPKIAEAIKIPYEEIVQEMVQKRKKSLTSNFLLEVPPTDSICYLPKYYHLPNDTAFFHLFKEAVDDYYNKYENYKRLVSCKLMEILIRICSEYISTEIENTQTHFPKAYKKVRDILNYIDTGYQQKISSSDIEQLFESNYDYLNRVFLKMTGYTIFNYLNIVRINKAKELIETTSIKFSEIGYLVGIEDPYYFSKLFKKYAGMAPSQYWEKRNTSI